MKTNKSISASLTSAKLRLFSMLIALVIVVGAALSIWFLRLKEIETWKQHMGAMTFMLTEHTNQTIFSASQALDEITKQIKGMNLEDEAQFRKQVSSEQMHLFMREKVRGFPAVEVASILASNGDNLNYTRSYPVPSINLSDRDYFKAHETEDNLKDFISAPVRNKGNGKWTFFLSRRLNDAQGNFLGLVLIGLSVEHFTDLYKGLAEELGKDVRISLFRDDLMLLAQAPEMGHIGEINKTGTTYETIVLNQKKADVVLSRSVSITTGNHDLRLSSIKMLDQYPLVVSLVVPDSVFLSSWMRMSQWIGVLTSLTILMLALATRILEKGLIYREKSESDIRESEAKFHTMVDWTSDWEYWIKPDGSLNYMTPSALQLSGYSAEEFASSPQLLRNIACEEDKLVWNRHLAEELNHVDNLEINQLELRIIHKNGSKRWFSHICRPVFAEDGSFLGRRATMRDITTQKLAEQEIHHLAYYDALTDLPNRRLLLDRISRALVSSDRSREFGALMMIDLDHFKRLNDAHGHDVGDQLLMQVAQRMTSLLRKEDTVARLGGDEFVLLMEGLGSDEQRAAQIAENLIEKIRSSLNKPYNLGVVEYQGTPSIGMTLFMGQEATADTLLKQADVALYQAKDAGRNAQRFFNPDMQKAVEHRIATELGLRRALQHNEFMLYYQPQVDQETRCIAAEALIRWFDPNRGLISPAEFIPLAEESGLILDLGQFVLDTACAQLVRWSQREQTRELHISINVSARQFHHPDFVSTVQRSVERNGADPAKLTLELTESVVLEHVDKVVEHMHQLNKLGIRFSLDDFGTGYSSLLYLKKLPLEQIKIDRSFVNEVATDLNDAAIIQAILAMSRSLDLTVVAEGVETALQRDYLLSYGCHRFQGYYFSRPLPIEELDEWINLRYEQA